MESSNGCSINPQESMSIQVSQNKSAWESDSAPVSPPLIRPRGSLKSLAQMDSAEREDLFWKQWVGTCTEMLDDVQAKLRRQEKMLRSFVHHLKTTESDDRCVSPATDQKMRSAAHKMDKVEPFASPFVPSTHLAMSRNRSDSTAIESIDIGSGSQAASGLNRSQPVGSMESLNLLSDSRIRTGIQPTSSSRLFLESSTGDSRAKHQDHDSSERSWNGGNQVQLYHDLDLHKRTESQFLKEIISETQLSDEAGKKPFKAKQSLYEAGTSTPLRQLVDKTEAFQAWLHRMKYSEPARTGHLADFVQSTSFTMLLSVVILSDSIYTAFASNRLMKHPNEESTLEMKLTETVFVLCYSLELMAKLQVHGKFFFLNADARWNWFDFLLVLQALIDIVMEYALAVEGANVTFIRLIRLVKLVKILRLFKAVKFLRELRVIMVSIMNCLTALFWAFIMLALILYIFALFFVQNTSGYLVAEEGNISEDEMSGINKFYGTVEDTIMTLYQSSCGGLDWREAYDVAEKCGLLNSLGFIFFTIFFNFAVFNILSGIFIEKALAAAAPDREQQALEQRRIEEQESHELTKLLRRMDLGASGKINLKDFMAHSMKPESRAYLRVLGIEVHDAVMFFKVLTRVLGADDLPIEEFVNRLFKMKGTATALDLQGLSFEVTVIHKMLEEIALHCGISGSIPHRIYSRSTHVENDDE